MNQRGELHRCEEATFIWTFMKGTIMSKKSKIPDLNAGEDWQSGARH